MKSRSREFGCYNDRIALSWMSRLRDFTRSCGKTSVRLDNHPKLVAVLARRPSWWRHQMKAFSALLALCVGNSPVTGKFFTQRASNVSNEPLIWLSMHVYSHHTTVICNYDCSANVYRLSLNLWLFVTRRPWNYRQSHAILWRQNQSASYCFLWQWAENVLALVNGMAPCFSPGSCHHL